MKNIFKVLGMAALIAAIGFSFMSCGDDSGDAGLTITGLSAYNDSYVVAMGQDQAETWLGAAVSFNESAGTATTGKISSGSVTLNVWELSESVTAFEVGESYRGSGAADFEVYICEDTSVSMEDGPQNPIAFGYLTVTFKNGVASGTFVLDED
jgi:hypothetical protein